MSVKEKETYRGGERERGGGSNEYTARRLLGV